MYIFQKTYQEEMSYLDTMSTYAKNIKTAPSLDEAKKELDKAYQFIKDVGPDYYMDGKINIAYVLLRERLTDCEMALPEGFIIESLPEYQKDKEKSAPSSSASAEEILSWLVHETRGYLAARSYHPIFNRKGIEDLSFTNYCYVSANYVEKICKQHSIPCKKVVIHPGFDEKANLLGGDGFHFFNIVKIKGSKYLVDCTYRQFFVEKTNSLNRLGVMGISGCLPGCFMTMTEDRLNVASTILKKGYMPLTEQNMKNYFDGFALSYRNGLYYEETSDFSFTTPYTGVDYLDFISGKDSQIKHESKEVLGFQEKPLKNPKMLVKHKKGF